ncbi:MAG: hypothetical protein KDC54_05220 [Lewinella sp.]|nr:hypothetical protein [Lewinella sp.]
MTLGEFFNAVSEQPIYIVFYFAIIPVTALLAGWLATKEEGEEAPWSYLYSTLLYLVCVPGIFALTLNIYLWLFERGSVLDYNLLTQVLPFASMLVTILIVRRNVNLDRIPGFNRLSGLIVMITAVLLLMWIIDRTHLIVFSYVPIQWVLLILVGLLLLVRFGWSRLIRS